MITLTYAKHATYSHRCLYNWYTHNLKLLDKVTNTPRSLELYRYKLLSNTRCLIKCLHPKNPLNDCPEDQCYYSLPKYLRDLKSQFTANLSKTTTLDPLDPITRTLETQKLISFQRKKGYRDKGRSDNDADDSRGSFKMTLATTMAILSVFGKPSTGDIQEERAKLSDKEKWERMKPIEAKIAMGVLWMCDQEYGKANELFHAALRMAQDEGNDEQENLVLNLIATNYFESGDWESAEKLFIDLIKRMVARDISTTSPAILELSLKLASIYSKSKATHQKALKGFKFVINSLLHDLSDILLDIDDLDIQTLSDEKKDALALLGWSYDWFAKHLVNMNDYNGATDMFQRAMQISSKVLGQQHDQTLILLNDIGTTLAMNNEPEKGRNFIKKAVEGAIETQSKELASFYVNLGLVNLKLRKFQEAKRYCEYSIELIRKNRDYHNSHDVIELSKSCLNEVNRFVEANDK